MTLSCTNNVLETQAPLSGLSPTISYIRSGAKQNPVSFKANVEVYRSSDRSAAPPTIVQKYKLAVKTIGERMYLRMDYPASAFNDGKARICVSDGASLRVLDAETLTTQIRQDLQFDPQASLTTTSAVFRPMALLAGRINIDTVRQQYRSLGFDLNEEGEAHGLTVSVPASALAGAAKNGRVFRSARLLFDTANEAYAGMDVVYADPDGTVVSVNQRPVYEEKDGILIKTGEVTETFYDRPGTIDISDAAVKAVADPEAVPVITAQELEELKASGAMVMEMTMPVGDMSSPDETITEIAVYDYIEVDTLDDHYFRIGL